jgi:hypothetical protein
MFNSNVTNYPRVENTIFNSIPAIQYHTQIPSPPPVYPCLFGPFNGYHWGHHLSHGAAAGLALSRSSKFSRLKRLSQYESQGTCPAARLRAEGWEQLEDGPRKLPAFGEF